MAEGNVADAPYYVWAACVFDFLDGFAARILKVSSPIGKDLDSLADVVSFGALPAFFMYYELKALNGPAGLPYVALLIAVCSALRLAVFNNDETQSDAFKGLPTPANTLFITGLPFLFPYVPALQDPALLMVIVVLFSVLLVSRFELFALKFKSFSWAGNRLRYTFLLLALVLLVIFRWAALPLIVILYIALSLGTRVFSRQ